MKWCWYSYTCTNVHLIGCRARLSGKSTYVDSNMQQKPWLLAEFNNNSEYLKQVTCISLISSMSSQLHSKYISQQCLLHLIQSIISCQYTHLWPPKSKKSMKGLPESIGHHYVITAFANETDVKQKIQEPGDGE